MMRNSSVLFLFLLSFSLCFSQEIETPLYFNPALKDAAQSVSERAAVDTLDLPFRDDFSQFFHYPDANKWLDRAVYINSNFPYSPPTIGVATFDGLKENGEPYTYGIISGRTDSLTSKPIRLGSYTSFDNVYLSFYYQMKGRGDMPEDDDTLSLEFRYKADSLYAWKRIWYAVGTNLSNSDTSFRFVILPIFDTTYLKDGFQFRFRTWGGRYGNIDQWHLDYVYLNHTRNANDSVFRDVGFVNPLKSILQFFTSVPWSHYKYNPVANESTVYSEVKNLDATNTSNTAIFGGIFNSDWNEVRTLPSNTAPVNPRSKFTFTQAVPASPFPDASGKQFEHFIIKSWINPGGLNEITENDTARYVQRFYDYYAYDDGTAESGYGILSQGAQIAYKFNPVKTGDTLTGVQIYFTYMVNDVREKRFRLMVWEDAGGRPGNVLFQQDAFVKPMYDGLLDFHVYDLSEAKLVINGPFYIGWLQESFDVLNIGVDKNTNANAFMFYRTTQTWFQTQFTGSWMMRPMFGASRYPYSVKEEVRSASFDLYPNPAVSIINLRSDQSMQGRSFTVTDLSGRTLISGVLDEPSIDVTMLPAGMYFLHLQDAGLKKFIISSK